MANGHQKKQIKYLKKLKDLSNGKTKADCVDSLQMRNCSVYDHGIQWFYAKLFKEIIISMNVKTPNTKLTKIMDGEWVH